MANTAIQPSHSDPVKGRKGPRPNHPNYGYIHRNLLPVEVHPLPVLIPHNPLSLIAIALSYLTQYLSPPPRTMYKGYFSSATSSIHVTDPATIRALWEMGFFGRGSLSRSEPTWLAGEKKIAVTAADVTGQRRNERRQIKLERARKEQEEIAKQLLEENTRSAPSTPDQSVFKTNENNINGIDSVLESATTGSDDKPEGQYEGFEEWKQVLYAKGLPTPPATTASSEADHAEARPVKRLQRAKTVRFSPTIEAREFDLSSPVISPIKSPGTSSTDEKVEEPTENKEHLNLSLEEAFFLSYGLGVLDVYCENTDTLLPATSLLSLFRRHSYSPIRSLSIAAEPDDPFMLSYAVYHHYRSLGWIVRSGVKFSVDFLLYNRGPAFSHAEFAVVILPSYSHKYWNETKERNEYVASRTTETWWWLHGVNRVQAQVHKQLILCYVDIPPPLTKDERGTQIDIGRELTRYHVQDVAVKRWTPNRSRD